jgi:hypothetical protein
MLLGAGEPLECSRTEALIEPGTRVADQDRPAVGLSSADVEAHASFGAGVADGVLEEVVEEAAEEHLVPAHLTVSRHRRAVEAHASVDGSLAPPVERLLDEVADVDGIAPHRQRAGVLAGQEQEGVGEPDELMAAAQNGLQGPSGWP